MERLFGEFRQRITASDESVFAKIESLDATPGMTHTQVASVLTRDSNAAAILRGHGTMIVRSISLPHFNSPTSARSSSSTGSLSSAGSAASSPLSASLSSLYVALPPSSHAPASASALSLPPTPVRGAVSSGSLRERERALPGV